MMTKRGIRARPKLNTVVGRDRGKGGEMYVCTLVFGAVGPRGRQGPTAPSYYILSLSADIGCLFFFVFFVRVCLTLSPFPLPAPTTHPPQNQQRGKTGRGWLGWLRRTKGASKPQPPTPQTSTTQRGQAARVELGRTSGKRKGPA